MMKNLKQIITDDNGIVSHKRILGIIGFLSLTGAMLYNSIYPKEFTPSPELVEAMEWLTMSAMFGTVLEKFSKK
jgi:hypothetical protein